MKTIFRVDSRIVHGQTVNYWCSKYEISKIIVVNDELANDSFKKIFFKIATPREFDLEFFEIKEAVNMEFEEGSNYMIIFKNIEDVVAYVHHEGKLSELIISNVGYGDGKTKISEGVFLNEEECKQVEVLKRSFGVHVSYKVIPE